MSSEAALAYTVHHKGRKYLAGTTAEDIGPVAAEFGDHVWVDGKPPAKSSIPKEGEPDGGTNIGAPPVPTPSALPGPDSSADIAAVTGTQAPGPAPAEPGPAEPAAKKSTGSRAH